MSRAGQPPATKPPKIALAILPPPMKTNRIARIVAV
jgi:hypothetical protein